MDERWMRLRQRLGIPEEGRELAEQEKDMLLMESLKERMEQNQIPAEEASSIGKGKAPMYDTKRLMQQPGFNAEEQLMEVIRKLKDKGNAI